MPRLLAESVILVKDAILVDDKDIGSSMVDLRHLQRAGRSEGSGNGSGRLLDRVLAPASGALVKIDILEPRHDCPPMWRLQAC